MLLLGQHRNKYFGVTLVAAALGGAEGVLHPLLMKAIFDAVSAPTDTGHFVYLVLSYLALGVSMNVFGYFLSLWQQRLDNHIVKASSTKLLRAFFDKHYSDVLRDGSGYYVARIRSDVKDGLVPMLPLVRKIVVNFVTFLTLVAVLIYISWQAFLLLSAIIPVATFVSIVVSKKIRGLTIAERDTEASLLNTLTKSVSAFKMACTFNMVGKTVSTFSTSMDQVLDSGYKKFRVIRRLQVASDLTMVISDVCSIAVGAIFVFRQQMTIGSFIAFMNAFWRSATTLIEIFRQWAELHSHSATINRLVAFLDEHRGTPFHRVGGAVAASDISYRYANAPIITGFSMRVEAGQSALIVGQNGSGKTTLANILSGFLTPSAGQLELPRRISSVTLPIQFPPVKVSELPADRALLASLGIDDPAILDSFPDQLSAGQQQKLSLAVALTEQADLYILDEPLANLDPSSRAVAMEEIRRHTRGKMLVMIMHGAEEYASMFDQVHILGNTPTSSEARAVAVG